MCHHTGRTGRIGSWRSSKVSDSGQRPFAELLQRRRAVRPVLGARYSGISVTRINYHKLLSSRVSRPTARDARWPKRTPEAASSCLRLAGTRWGTISSPFATADRYSAGCIITKGLTLSSRPRDGRGDGRTMDAPSSVFHSDLSIETKLEKARTELLDLSARNRLLNVPRFSKATKTIEVVDERSVEVFRLLVGEGRTFTFLPGRVGSGGDGDAAQVGEAITELPQPSDEGMDERGVAARHADTRLQTRMTSNGLQTATARSLP